MRIHPFLRCAGCLGLLPIICLSLRVAQAGSATWKANPTSHDWNTAANWSPETVPNGPGDVATFGSSSKTEITFSATATEVAEIVFEPGASSFNITAIAQEPATTVTLTISGAGIINNSGVTQSLTAGPTVKGALGIINFLNSATAGEGTALAALGQGIPGSFSGSLINFYDTSSAGNASIYAEGARAEIEAYGGEVNFYNNATAGNASCIVTGSFKGGSYGAEINFRDDSSAGKASFRVYGSDFFHGGEVNFVDNSTGETAQFTILDGGSLDIIGQFGQFGEVTVGSITGTGVIGMESNTLSVGANNLSSSFRGTITGDLSASLIKIGSGTLTLKGASVYGDTLVTEGTLLAANLTGSATGRGVVEVEGGTLGGGGTISGAVMVGTGSGSGSVLDPAASTGHIVTLVAESNLTMQSDATYHCTIDFKHSKATSVTTTGVTLSNGPTIVLTNIRNGTLAQGTVFKIISNTGANPISGTFSNLADGAIVNVGGMNFQADYQGGDGNDLTLTVVP